MAKIVWTTQSRDDLRAIKAYIARDAPRTAELFVRRLIKSTERLRRSPLAGSIVEELRHRDVREILHGNYRIIYRAGKNVVEILTVYHAARLLDERAIFRDTSRE
jgi:addiction module RelE/StbE family toxin